MIQDVLDWLRRIAPSGALVAGGRIGRRAPGPFPEEEKPISRAIDSRRWEFRAGRDFARQAIAGLGYPPTPLLATLGGPPQWPAGVVASLTHTDAFAIAAAAPSVRLRGIGVDLEGCDPIEGELIDAIFTPAEAERIRAAQVPADLAKIAFVAKEAACKAAFTLDGLPIAFQEIEVALAAATQSFRARRVNWGGARPTWERIEGRVRTFPALTCALAWSPVADAE